MFICYYSLVWAFLPFFLPYLAFFCLLPKLKKKQKKKKARKKKNEKSKIRKKGKLSCLFRRKHSLLRKLFCFLPFLDFLFLIVCLCFSSLLRKLEKPFARPNKIKSSWAN